MFIIVICAQNLTRWCITADIVGTAQRLTALASVRIRGTLTVVLAAVLLAVLPRPRRNGEQVTIEEYMRQILSCDDPNKVFQLLGECSRKYEDALIAYHTEEFTTKILWAANHPDTITKQDHGCGCEYGKHRCTDKRAEQ